MLSFVRRYRFGHRPTSLWLGYLLILILTLPAVWELLAPGYFSMHDDLQILRLEQLHRCFLDGQIPCRWIPDAGFGYGYPMFNYYPPLPYFLAEALHLLGFSFFWAIKLTFIISFLLSGWFMFLLASKFFGSWGGLVAAVFYIYAPYHSVDVYVRGAMNEAWGLVFFPLILYAAHRLITASRYHRHQLILLSISYAALLLSHNVMTLIFTPILGLWSAFWLLVSHNWARLKPLVFSGLWAVGLSAFFLIPVVLEKDLVHVESMTIGYFNYLAHFADLNQMFFSRFWGYGGSIWGPDDDMAFPIGHLHWGLAILAALLALFHLIRSKKKVLPLLLLGIIPVTLAYTFLIHPRSIWFWDNLPLLYYAQFPWRLLAIPAFTLSFLAGSLLQGLSLKLNFQPRLGRLLEVIISTVLITGVIAWNLPFFKVDRKLTITLEEKLSGRLWELQTTGGIFDYLPKSASRPPGEPTHVLPIYVEGQGGIENYQSGTNWAKFTARVSQAPAVVQLPIFDWPNWIVKANGKKLDHSFDSDLGRIQISLPSGTQQIEARLYNTPVRTFANLLSLIFLLILIVTSRKLVLERR